MLRHHPNDSIYVVCVNYGDQWSLSVVIDDYLVILCPHQGPTNGVLFRASCVKVIISIGFVFTVCLWWSLVESAWDVYGPRWWPAAVLMCIFIRRPLYKERKNKVRVVSWLNSCRLTTVCECNITAYSICLCLVMTQTDCRCSSCYIFH